ncbi:MAG: hypothetical protein M1818_002898 [Claussenomyces sp. TS43310]|nr:MAG: hypothetical protein M1818_002898 [Claussenomyces sp. TS43310]
MSHYHELSIAVAAAGLGLVLIATISSARTLAPSLISAKKNNFATRVYEDKDGVSTEEATAKYSLTVSKALICIFTLLGLGTSIASVVLTALGVENGGLIEYLTAPSWVLLAVQAIGITLSRIPTQTFALGIHGVVSCIILAATLLVQEGVVSTEVHGFEYLPIAILRLAQLVLVFCTGLAHACLPRRPEVFTSDGRPIDSFFTVSALSRYTCAWCADLLSVAKRKGALELNDLPRPDHRRRAHDVTHEWLRADRKGALWKNIFLAHKWNFLLQLFLTFVQSFGSIAPQFMLLQILRLLEIRDRGKPIGAKPWLWVFGLGLATIASSWVEMWLTWVCQSELAIPVRAELSELIFEKSMRRKDVKGSVRTAKKDLKVATNEDIGASNVNIKTAPEAESGLPRPGEEDGDGEDKSSQSTINLIGVDAKRISDLCTFGNFLPQSVFKLPISFLLLLEIIGWRALGAGLLSMLVIIPVNAYFSTKYSKAQGRLMNVRDKKEARISEALKGIRQIKFSAIESRWQAALTAVRTQELETLWDVFLTDTVLLSCWISSPVIMSATSLSVYSLTSRLTPSVAFTSIAIFNQLQITLSVVPELVTDSIDAFVSMKRIQKYLEAPEVDPNLSKNSTAISFENASVAWPADEAKTDDDDRFVLRDVNISFPVGELSVISGKTGSGKSLLLASVLNEVDLLSGSIYVPRAPSAYDRHDSKVTKADWVIPSSIAFVAQIPWIENATVKENILFGLPFDAERYEKTLEHCALRKDIEMMTDGENTEIGTNGINLSGGQKWRLSFARALYSRAGILVLDDILSAVDAHVGRHIFEKGLTGELGIGRTRLLCTHHIELVKSKAKYLVELGDGTVQHAATLSALEEEGLLERIISQEEDPEQIREDQDITAIDSEDPSNVEAESGEMLKKIESKSAVRKFTEDETKEKGAVKARLYLEYMYSAGGIPFWALALFLFIAHQALTLGLSWWLRIWTGSNEELMESSRVGITVQRVSAAENLHAASEDNHLFYYLSVYIALSIASSFLGTFTFFYMFLGSIKASRDLFNRLTHTVLRAPLRWHDTVPLGRILNRFTADFNIVDSRLANDICAGVRAILRLVGVMVAGLFVTPYVLILAVVLASICFIIADRYMTGAREVKRLESIAKSPVFSQFGSSLAGIATIRAFDKTNVYTDKMEGLLDDYTTTVWYLWAFNRWMGFRMGLIGGLFSAIVAGCIVAVPNLDAALSGFALFFALEYTGAITWTVRHYTNLELDMNTVERVVEYATLETESQDGVDPPAAWPSEGRLEVSNLSVTYAPDLPPVLKKLSFNIEGNQRVGVVGRTGAGKSSLTLALFRFLEAIEGSILIDGIDISKIKLEALRGRLAIIPQDPVLFSGTVRSNLDPFDEHTDKELTDALKRVHLIASGSGSTTPIAPTSANAATEEQQNWNAFEDLLSPISASGLNLSQGQRQLLCLARAIVSRPKIMVLDEATSAVDMATDALIQRSIREEFNDSTLIVIAHRLSTIADFDKILVMGEGQGLEFGTPRELMDMHAGVFRSMVVESGDGDRLKALIMGEGGGVGHS